MVSCSILETFRYSMELSMVSHNVYVTILPLTELAVVSYCIYTTIIGFVQCTRNHYITLTESSEVLNKNYGMF